MGNFLKKLFNLEVKKEPRPDLEPEMGNFDASKKFVPIANNPIPVDYQFDGETTPYEMGTPFEFGLEYYTLRQRAWELFLKTDFVQNALKKYCLWLVGSGLKLQSEPVEQVLSLNGINLSKEQLNSFRQNVESSFRLFANSYLSSYSGNIGESIHYQIAEALKNAFLAGDVLCLNNFDGKKTTFQFIDGGLIRTPFNKIDAINSRGHKVIDGVEMNKKGEHIAFYVYEAPEKYKRIRVKKTSGGIVSAWLMYGLKGKKEDVRGMGLLTACMQTASQLDRYKDASVGSAEERAKNVFFIERGIHSDESPVLDTQIAGSIAKAKQKAPETTNETCDQYAENISMTTKKMVKSLPRDTKIVYPTNTSDVNFSSFWAPNIDIVYTTMGMPPEVASDKFGGSYSGSRAALKSWEYKVFTDRIVIISRQCYQPIYNFWLHVKILQNKISAPGYLLALNNNNEDVILAYQNARFIGATVPHIDPVKEANAVNLKLGDKLKNIPKITLEQAIEELNGGGDYDQIIKKITDEIEIAEYFITPNADSATE